MKKTLDECLEQAKKELKIKRTTMKVVDRMWQIYAESKKDNK